MVSDPNWLKVLGIVADILSILGFGLTLFVAVSVRSIRRDYVFRAIVPRLVEHLEGHATCLNDHITDLDRPGAANIISVELKRAEATLESLVAHLRAPEQALPGSC